MKKKLSVKQCIDIAEVLVKIKQSNSLNFSFAWALDDTLEAIKTLVERGQQEQQKLLTKYGDEDPKKPGVFTIEKDKVPAYTTELEPIYNYSKVLDLPVLNIKDFKRENVTIPAGVSLSVLRLIAEC